MRFQGPDSHGWFSIGLFANTAMIFWLVHVDPSLRHDDLFKMLAQAVILTGLINLAASFYFGASKPAPQSQGGDA